MAPPNELPAIDQLANTPDILRMVLEGVTDDQTLWKPGPQRWSIAEILEHLSHTEGNLFRFRVEKMVNEDQPRLEDYDQEALAAAGHYRTGDAEESFAHWEEQREDNLEYLRSLQTAAAGRTGVHEKLGVLTVAEVLHAWAFHDLGHIRQLIEIVRAVRFYPAMGPLQNVNRVEP